MIQPKLRFKREDGTSYPDWNKKKIGDLANIFSASRVHRDEWQTEGIPFWRSSDVMAFHQHKVNPMGKAYITQELYEKLSSKSGKMQKDDILITGGGSIGIPYLIQDDCPLYVKDADLLCIQKSVNHNSGFLYQFFWSPTFRNYLRLISHKGTIAHYTITQIGETPVAIPCLEEQQKIADFLSTVDEVILQSELEVQNLEQQKKTAMQKIFSQEVRFKREDGAEYPEWEEKTIGELGTVITGNTPPTKDKDNYGGDFLWVTPTDISGFPIIYETERKLTEKGKTKARLLPKDTVLVTCIASIGKNCILSKEGSCNQQINAIIPFSFTNSYYLLNVINLKKHELEILGGNGGMKIVSKSLFESFVVPFPCLDEQQKISDFLFAYDEAIACTKQELDKWKELKKGLLQQMFA